MEGLLTNLLSAFGLSGAAGLNAYVPLLAVGLMDRLGWVELQGSYDWLASPLGLLVIGAVALLDFVGDKVPGVDHLLHTLGGWVNPLAGAVVFASQHNLLGEVDPALSLIAGFLVAGGFHASRTALRPLATATTAGLGNPVVSLTEDLASVLLSVLAIVAPLLGLVVLGVLAWLLFMGWRRLTTRRRL